MTRTDIDHYAGLDIWGPVSREELQRLLGRLPMERGLRVLDVGCGKADLLVGLARQHNASITGVDISAAALALAQAEQARWAPEANATWIESAVDEVSFDPGSFDVILSLGGPYHHDKLDDTLQLYARWLRTGGHLVFGEGFWIKTPPGLYLAATGLPADALLSRDAYIALAAQRGLQSIDHLIATRAAWDHFEDTILQNHEAYARTHEQVSDAQEMIQRKRAWNDAQVRWGRDTMGFSVDVFEVRGD